LSCLSISYISSVSTHVAFLTTTTQIYFRIGISCTSISICSTNPRLRTIWNLIFPFTNVFCISTVHHWCSIVWWRIKISRIIYLYHIYLSFIPVMSRFLVFLIRSFTSRRTSWSQKLLRRIISNNNVFLRNTTVTSYFSSSSVMIWIWVWLTSSTTIWVF